MSDGPSSRPGWSRTAPARFTPASICGDAVAVWLVQVGLDELLRFVLDSQALIEGTSVPTPGVVRPVLVTMGTGGSAAREARPVTTGAELLGDCNAIARMRREPAFGA